MTDSDLLLTSLRSGDHEERRAKNEHRPQAKPIITRL